MSNNAAKEVRAALIIIGDEILSGRTQDANLYYLASWLNQAGVVLGEARIVKDIQAEIVDAVNLCRAKYDYVFTTGGIGPTHDDITSAAIAKAFGVELVRDPEAVAIFAQYYTPDKMTEARLKMADIPAGATLIENPVSAAPGFQIENVFVMAGIPAVMQAMLEKLRGRIKGAEPVKSSTITVFSGESAIAVFLGEVEAEFPGISIGSYPFYRPDAAGAGIVVRSTDEALVDAVLDRLRQGFAERDIKFVDGEV